MAYIYDLSDQWAASGTIFTGIKLSVTDTASAAGSLLMDLQVGGVSQFSVSKAGRIVAQEQIWSGNGSLRITGTAINFGGYHPLQWYTGGAYGAIGVALQPGLNLIEQRNGVNAQAFNLYNTYTDASNYERGFMKWVSGNLEIGAEGAGTGNANRKTRILASGGVVAEFENGYVGLYQSGTRNILINASSSPQIGLAGGSIGIGANAITVDAKIIRSAAGVLGIRGASTDGGSVELLEQTAPAAPATNAVRIYAEDDGAGKTRLMARFATGAAVQIAIEP